MGLIRPPTYTKLINTICKMVTGNEKAAKQQVDSRNVLKIAAADNDTMSQDDAMAIINQINKDA
jgi:Holliday junction resolvasome RuvABC endonuclease subunit